LSLPDFQFLTAQQIDAVLKKNIASEEHTSLVSTTCNALEGVSQSLILLGSPVDLGVIASIGSVITTLVGTGGDAVSTALDVASLGMALEQKINYGIDKVGNIATYETNENPDSLVFDAARWNKIIGLALNYNCPVGEEVVKPLEDGTFDFRFLRGFCNDAITQHWLSEELYRLLNCKFI